VHTFAHWYTRNLDFVSLNRAAIIHVILPGHEQALVIDASFIPKSGKKTYELDCFWNGSHSRTEKGLEISAPVTGLSDCQARSQAKLNFHFNASLSAVTLAKLAARQHKSVFSQSIVLLAKRAGIPYPPPDNCRYPVLSAAAAKDPHGCEAPRNS
jgi:hypothetical protein